MGVRVSLGTLFFIMKQYKLTTDKVIKINNHYINKLITNNFDEYDTYQMSIWLKQVNNFLEEYDNEKTNLILELSLLP